MAKGETRLGKGLAALLSESLEEAPPGAEREIPTDRVRANPYQPRGRFDAEGLEELVGSIRRNGLLQPIVVRASAEGYEIVAGERRWRAVRQLGWAHVPSIVRELTDEQMLVVALVENLQRENLSPLEEARAYRRLIDQFGLTQEDVGRQVGRDRSTVANALRLLALPEEVHELLAAGRITGGHARAILGLSEPAAQIALAKAAAEEGLSVRAVERRVRARRSTAGGARAADRPAPAPSDPVARRAELVLQRSLGTQVRIRAGRDASGEIRIPFHDHDDFLRLLGLIGGEDAARALEP